MIYNWRVLMSICQEKVPLKEEKLRGPYGLGDVKGDPPITFIHLRHLILTSCSHSSHPMLNNY